MKRPETNEYAPYYGGYISQISGENVLEALETQIEQLQQMLAGVPEEKGRFAYAPGKWTLKEALSHLIDCERVFAYRIFRISRGDRTPIEGFDQDEYIATSNANERTFANLIDELSLERKANLIMLENISDADSALMGTASGKPVSVRALTYIMAGHITHHSKILAERYLS